MITWCHTFPHHIWSSCLMLTPAIFVNNLTTIFNNLQHSSWKCLWKSGIRRHKLHKNVHRKATITLKYLQATATSMWQSRTAVSRCQECLRFQFSHQTQELQVKQTAWLLLMSRYQHFCSTLNSHFVKQVTATVETFKHLFPEIREWQGETSCWQWDLSCQVEPGDRSSALVSSTDNYGKLGMLIGQQSVTFQTIIDIILNNTTNTATVSDLKQWNMGHHHRL